MSGLMKGIGGLVKSLFGGGDEPETQPAPPAPKPEPVKVMPVPDDAAVKNARRRSIVANQKRRGRASTVLSEAGGGGETLG